jgi:hypothetical protein
MQEYCDPSARKIGNLPASGGLPEAQCRVEPWKFCVYNQTRELFLGVDVDAADFAAAPLDDRLPALALSSGAGLWLVPFRGILPSDACIPLDLVYLDRSCAVIETVESFPISRVSPSSPPAASVLILPGSTINSTQTQPGDQLMICAPGEMKRHLQRLPSSRSNAYALQSAADWQRDLLSQEEKNRSGPGQVLKFEDYFRQKPSNEDSPNVVLPREDHTLAQQSQGERLAEPRIKNKEHPKSWLRRLLFPDPPESRKAAREPLPGLTAHFWTGGASQGHGVRDISSTGLFMLTNERWYPGTVVRMTLTDRREPTAERSITLNARVIRWGNDGVGLRFVLQNAKHTRRGKYPLAGSEVQDTNKKQLEQFFQRFRSGNE